MMPFAGYDMPVQYDGILAEHARVRSQVGLFDVSHMGEVRFKGPDAVAAVNSLITNDLDRIGQGRAMYTCTCAEDGPPRVLAASITSCECTRVRSSELTSRFR